MLSLDKLAQPGLKFLSSDLANYQVTERDVNLCF